MKVLGPIRSIAGVEEILDGGHVSAVADVRDG